MVHVDVKKVGRTPDGGGWRVHGMARAKAVALATAAGTRAGYVYLHFAADGYSRLTYTEALTDEKAITASGCTALECGSPPTASIASNGSSSTTVLATAPATSPTSYTEPAIGASRVIPRATTAWWRDISTSWPSPTSCPATAIQQLLR